MTRQDRIMSIVNWEGKNAKDIKLTFDAENDQDLLMGVLQLSNTGEKWKGRLVLKQDQPGYSVELRKKFVSSYGSTNALVVVGIPKDTNPFRQQDYTEDEIRISANGTMQLTPAQLSEMNLAVLEAQNVLKNKNLELKEKN